MKTKLYFPLACAVILVFSACSSKINESSSTSASTDRNLLDVMNDKIDNITVGMWPTSNPPSAGLTGGRAGLSTPRFAKKLSYKIFDKEIHLIIDGVDVEQFYSPDVRAESTGDYIQDRNKAPIRDRMQFIDAYLKNIKAADVTSVQIITPEKYKEEYKLELARGGSLPVLTTDFVYIAVTTSSGNGAFMK